jgi:hypothetical protein
MSTNSDALAYTYITLSCLHEIGGKPTRKAITRTTKELTANAAGVESIYSKHSHVFLTLSAAKYQALNGSVAFVMPVAPAADPAVPENATQHAIAEAVRQHGVMSRAINSYARYRTRCANSSWRAATKSTGLRCANLPFSTAPAPSRNYLVTCQPHTAASPKPNAGVLDPAWMSPGKVDTLKPSSSRSKLQATLLKLAAAPRPSLTLKNATTLGPR